MRIACILPTSETVSWSEPCKAKEPWPYLQTVLANAEHERRAKVPSNEVHRRTCVFRDMDPREEAPRLVFGETNSIADQCRSPLLFWRRKGDHEHVFALPLLSRSDHTQLRTVKVTSLVFQFVFVSEKASSIFPRHDILSVLQAVMLDRRRSQSETQSPY